MIMVEHGGTVQMWNFQLFGKSFSTLDVVLFSCLYFFVTFAYKWKSQTKKEQRIIGRTLPGPWNFPIVGFLPRLGTRPFVTMWNLSQKYGSVYRIRMGHYEVVIVNGMEMMREAFIRQGKVFSGRPNFRSFKEFSGGKSLTFQPYSNGWRIHNKIAIRALNSFVTSKTQLLDELICRNATRLTDQLLSRCNISLDIRDIIEDSVLRVVYELCFGDAVTDEFCEAIKCELEHLRNSMPVVIPIDVMPWLGLPLRSQYNNFKRTLVRFEMLVNDLTSDVKKTIPDGQPKCIVHSLVRAVEELEASAESSETVEKDTIFATVQDLIGAGSEGVVNFIYWAIRYMVTYPEVQERLRAEVRDTLDLTKTIPVEKDRMSLPYVEGFIWEVIRHSAMSPLTLPHSALEDTVLAGYFIPKGTVLFGNMYSTGQDPRIWNDPEKFSPERFLEEDGGKFDRRKLEQFLCFGLGTRRCMGEMLGRVEMFLFLVIILQRCRFRSAADNTGDPKKLDGEMSLVYRSRPYKVIVNEL